MKNTKTARFDALKLAASAIALSVGAGVGGQAFAQAADFGLAPGATLDIVANHTVPPGPGSAATGANYANSPNVLSPAGQVNGIGQMIAFIQTSPTGAGLSLCSGTLINPRTVITAAHCVYNSPAYAYGADTGFGAPLTGAIAATFGPTTGIPLSFGFSSTNRCLGVAVNGCATNTGPYERWRDTNFSTQLGLNIFNANQVWYGRGSQPVGLGGGGEFANEDIALVTLDAHADGIPTWALLFSQLDSATHATVTGYGGAGVGLSGIGSLAGIDYRRRAAENMIDALFSTRDWVSSPAIGGPLNTQFLTHQHPIYFLDFDDPDHDPNNLPANFFNPTNVPPARDNGYYDFNGLGGAALPNEGATAGGDSGGPLVVDQRWSRQVVAGVLTGSLSFNGGISTYGQFNVYPPLFQFWEQIVQNNPYKYAASLPGNASWTNPAHWVQAMDPNYTVIGAGGALLTGLPDTNQGGADGAVDKFGTICFLEVDCTTFDGPGAPTGNGTMVITAGGPGTTNFVPNNVEPVNNPNAALHVRARYYDVTLGAPGNTWLTSAVTIDRFTMDEGQASLDIRSTGSLSVLTDAIIGSGLLNVDGVMNSGEMLVLEGIVTGRGTINPTYFTSVAGAIAPAGADVGTLSIRGDVALASASNLFVEVGRDGADQLRILADAAQGTAGNISLGGALRMVKASNGPAPRHGQVFTLVLADGAVLDTFDQVFAQTGVLRPEMVYDAHSVQIILRAGKFADVLEGSVQELAFANALDRLRDGSYGLLYDLYGELDVMDSVSLQRAFGSLMPSSLLDANALLDMQSSAFGDTLTDRMSLLSRSGASGFSVMGSPGQVLSFGGDDGLAAAGELAFASRLTESSQVAEMPNGMSAFFSGGYDENRASAVSGRSASTPDDGMRTWQMIGGIEQSFGDFRLGFAGGYSRGEAFQVTGAQAENEVSQAAVYGVYSFDNGAYLSGMIGAGTSRVSTERRLNEGLLDYHMAGDVNGEIFLASAEAGVNIDMFDGYTLTPHVALRQYSVSMDGFTESGGEAALDVSEQEYNRLEARLGARLAGDHVFSSGWRFVPSLDAAVVANLGGDEGGVWARFAAAPDESFFLPGSARDDYWGEVSGGLSLVRGDTSFALHMETSVGRQELHDDRYTARVVQRF